VPGYQEIGDGLLILLKEPKGGKKFENVGPGSYDANFDSVKLKSPNAIFKKYTEKKKNDQQNLK
jgi:hypothetical protein